MRLFTRATNKPGSCGERAIYAAIHHADRGGQALFITKWARRRTSPTPLRGLLLDGDRQRLIESVQARGVRDARRLVNGRPGPGGGQHIKLSTSAMQEPLRLLYLSAVQYIDNSAEAAA